MFLFVMAPSFLCARLPYLQSLATPLALSFIKRLTLSFVGRIYHWRATDKPQMFPYNACIIM